MGAGSQSRVEEVREALGLLSRAVKRICIYRHAADKHASYLSGALAGLQGLLEREPVLNLGVEPTALKYEGEMVCAEPAREGSLCFRLHRDGVRAISFTRGLSLAELLAFAGAALPEAGGGGREDAVTELWKADLQSIRYTAVPGYRLDEGKEEERQSLDAVAAVSERARRSLELYATNFEPEDETAARAQGPLLRRSELRAFDPQDWVDLAERSAEILLEIVRRAAAGRDLAALEEAFAALIDEMLERRAEPALIAALERVSRLEGKQAEVFRGALGKRLSDPSRLSQMLDLAARSPGVFNRALPLWLDLLPKDSGAALLPLLEAQTSAPLRAALARAAVERLLECRPRSEQTLRSGSEAAAKALLAALSEVPPGVRASVATRALAHASPAVHLAAIPLIAADPKAALEKLGPLLVHAEADVRVAAADALGGCAKAAPEATRLLLAAVEKPEFARLGREGRATFYRALGRLGTDAGFEELVLRLVRGRRRALKGLRVEEEQLLAVNGIAAEGSRRAEQLLSEAAEEGYAPMVSAACRAAARNLRAALSQGGRAA